MQFFKKIILFLTIFTSFNFFAATEPSQTSYVDATRAWLKENQENHPTFWKCIFFTSGAACFGGVVISSLKTGLYLLLTLKEILSKKDLMESNEEQEERVLNKFYKMVASLFAAGMFFAGLGFFDKQHTALKNV